MLKFLSVPQLCGRLECEGNTESKAGVDSEINCLLSFRKQIGQTGSLNLAELFEWPTLSIHVFEYCSLSSAKSF